jgi:GalNAc-alpha-(1->4)-GalNAc-alpha-(1->3)-diNAcBac-PP-undecaprenol alpha-1,4-N-acetyl-D-galactosaminyltransferase
MTPRHTATQRITILISSLQGGGAERVASVLANGLASRHHAISVVTLAGPHEPFYPLGKPIAFMSINIYYKNGYSVFEIIGNRIQRTRLVQRACAATRPDVLISFMTENNVCALIAGRVLSHMPCPIIVSERVHPALHRATLYTRAARRLTFPLADAVVTCSREMTAWYARWLPRNKVIAIQNPVRLDDRPPDPDAERTASQMQQENWIAAMGRLDRQKGFDLLLEAFSRISSTQRADWKLGILGEGPLRSDLERRIAALGLRGRAFLLGRFRNPYPILRAAKVFALSSRYEGFPNALTEAMACGAAAVSFACQSGPREIIRHGVDGLLVPPEDVEGLTAALLQLTGDEELRRRLSSRAPEVLERFSETRFLDAWEDLIAQLTRVPRLSPHQMTYPKSPGEAILDKSENKS